MVVFINTQRILFIWGISTSFLGFACSLHMEMFPPSYNRLVHTSLDVSCVADGVSEHDVVVLQIERPGQEKPLAVIDKRNGLSGRSDVKARGYLDKSGDKYSNLTVTIDRPGASDTGLYVCVMSYLDKTYQLKEVKTNLNVTMDNNDITALVTHFAEKLQDQSNQLESFKAVIAKQNEKSMDQAHQIEVLNDKLNDQDKQIDLLKTHGSYQCAFSVRYNHNDKIQEHTIMRFTDELLNIGKGYDVTTGVFTAPKDGLYVFHLVATTFYNNGEVLIYLQKNGSTESGLYAKDKDYRDQASVAVVWSLRAGDKVRPYVVSITGGSQVYSFFSVFSGYLLALS